MPEQKGIRGRRYFWRGETLEPVGFYGPPAEGEELMPVSDHEEVRDELLERVERAEQDSSAKGAK